MSSPPPSFPKRAASYLRLPPPRRFRSIPLPTAFPLLLIPILSYCRPLPLSTNSDSDFSDFESPLTPIATQTCSIYTYTIDSKTVMPESDLRNSGLLESERVEAVAESRLLEQGGDSVVAMKPKRDSLRGFVTPLLTDRLYWQNPKRAKLVDFMCLLYPGYWDLIFGFFVGWWEYLWWIQSWKNLELKKMREA